MVENFIYNIANTKSYGHIMVDINDWNDDKLIMQVSLKGKLLPTFITKCIKINSAPAYRPVPFTCGDLVALSAIAVRIGVLKPFQLPNDPNKYSNVHLSQVLGYFKEPDLNKSIDNFVPIYDKVVMEKVEVPMSNYLSQVIDSMSVGRVIKTGDGGFTEAWDKRPMKVKEGDIVLIRDNVTTTISVNREEYYVTNYSYIVGKFTDNTYDLESLELYDDNISIFEDYENDRIEGSFLYRPVVSNKEEMEISALYQENLFKLVKSSQLEDGVYYISRFDTEYILFKGKKYYVVNNDKIMARKAKGDLNGRI